MSNKNDNNTSNTPQLRFPGFIGEWEEKKLGEVGIFIRGLSYNNSEITSETSSTLVIRSNNIIQDKNIDYKCGVQYVTKKPSTEQILRNGDIAICLANGSSNLVGKSASFDGKHLGIVTVGAFCGIYRSDSPIVKYLVQTSEYKENINLIKQGGNGALANLYGKDILSLKFKFPSTFAEQQKIADCLSALDDMINAEGQKTEALREYKRGLMQQLFPANGASTPKLRFPGFTGEWEEKKLGEVFDRIAEKNIENNQNVLTISALYGLINQLDFFNKSVSASDVTGYYLLHKGDFAYNKSRSQGKPVGAIKPLKLYDKGCVSTLYICFRCKNPNQIGFWEQYFDAGILDKNILSIAQEGARNHGLLNISTNEFFDLSVIFPAEESEQQKIADCLSTLDELINAQVQRTEALREYKRGLMQQLFPQQNKQ